MYISIQGHHIMTMQHWQLWVVGWLVLVGWLGSNLPPQDERDDGQQDRDSE